ncbi:rho GTPase-activating protein 15 isoform 2-T2 [Menidia menidia]
MASTRITNAQGAVKPVPLIQSAHRSAAVQMRLKNSQSSGDRLSQSKSMVLQETDLPPKPISRHRRNQSQHNVVMAGGATFEPLADIKGEHLNVAKISDGGKKQRKNWASMWTVLTSDQLLFYKDKQESAVKPGAKTDVVQLGGAVIEWTTEKSSKKNVFMITTNTGSEYLVQSDNSSTASKWYDAIKKTTKEDKGFPLRRSNSTEFLPRHSSLPGYGSASPSSKQRNPAHRRSINMFSSSKLKYSTSDSADKSGVKNRLKKFIIRRPSMKTLQEKGLIKDRVFGCHLLTLCEREGSTVPKFVQICVDAVEKRGLDANGIYRVSGNLATIQKIRFIIDQEEDLDLDQSQWEDIHVVTGALKLFFRELPEPLFPFKFFQPFVDTVKIKDSREKTQAVKKLIQKLPKPNHDTMKVLFTHLQRVLAFSKKNLMSTQGIGIVFGPTLMWPELDSGNMAVNMVYQNQIVEFILIESREIFNMEAK